MTPIKLNEETLALAEEQAARQGFADVNAYLASLIYRAGDQNGPRNGASSWREIDQWCARWREWAASHPIQPIIADDSRESIYGEDDR